MDWFENDRDDEFVITSHPVLTMLAFSQKADNADTVSSLILGT